MNYTFSTLNDKEFEDLVMDLLSAHLSLHVERFKSGVDQGVDGRFFVDKNKETIIQCKHYLRSGLKKLFYDLEKKELNKVIKLKPFRYMFATSLPLSRSDKKEIKNIFEPYIKCESDVLGCEDLNDIISRNNNIEKNHYKLWLSSTVVLEAMLNSAIIGRSEFKVEEIKKNLERYVPTVNHEKSLEKLEKIKAVIITGEPGIGKTTLAEQLCNHYAASGYELCILESSISEAEAVFNEEINQVFYFDDFLGSNYLEVLRHNQDSQIMHFIKRIKAKENKRFILTSRTNILNQGKQLSEKFFYNHLSKSEFEITIKSLGNLDKAKILYNHIFFGELGSEFIDELYKDKRYIDIIEHRNYNPRIISFITDSHHIKDLDPLKYWDFIEGNLENPERVWEFVFEKQLDKISVHLVVAVAFNGSRLEEDKLESCFYNLKSSFNIEDGETFKSVIKPLTGALLNRFIENNEYVFFNLFNPSIADYVLSRYLKDTKYISRVFLSLMTIESLDFIYNISRSEKYSKCNWQDFFQILIEQLPIHTCVDYLVRFISVSSSFLSVSMGVSDQVERIINALVEGEIGYNEDVCQALLCAERLSLLAERKSEVVESLRYFLENLVDDFAFYPYISRLITKIALGDKEIIEIYKNNMNDYFEYELTQLLIENDVLPDLFEYEYEDHPEVEDFINKLLSRSEISFSENEIEDFLCHCDYDEIARFNLESHSDEYIPPSGASFERGDVDRKIIHDLFERS